MNHPAEEITRGADSIDFDALAFESTFVRALPGDSVLANVPRQVRHAAYTPVEPTPVRAPTVLAWSDAVGRTLGIAPPASPQGLEAQVLGGNKVLPGMRPY